MMKLLTALCLILCAMLLSSCNHINTPPSIVKNEVPPSLLVCDDEPEKLNFRTGDNKKDFQNITTYAAQVKTAGADCRSKLAKVKGLVLIQLQKKPQ